MTSRELIAEAAGRDVSRETSDLLVEFADLLTEEARSQNLVSAATLDDLWTRHIVDSAQLVRFEPRPNVSWIDIGSGAGLPGIVIALLVRGQLTLVEPRRLRAEFLRTAVDRLGLVDRVTVIQSKAERVEGKFDVLTGRAVAPLGKFLSLSDHLSTKNSLWVLPKGQSAQSELAEARRSWHCVVRVEASCTDPNSRILLLERVERKR